MPNGGLGHCGGCLHNLRLLLTEAFAQDFGVNPGFCTLRKVLIPDCGYTYCANCEYDDCGEEIHQQQLERVLSNQVEIHGSIWTDNTYTDSGWPRSPHNHIRWDYAEWKRWNAYVQATYPKLFSQQWLTDISPWEEK